MRNTLTSNLLSHKKGVALITVVGVTFFMSLMTATLVATHSSNFALMLDSANQKQAYLAASSGLDYAKFRLSQQRTLGLADQAPKKDVFLGDMVIEENAAGTELKAEFPGSVPPRSFKVTVENLLNSNAADTSRGLPAHCIVLKVHGTCGTFQANTETVLVEAPLYDSAAISNGPMDMSEVKSWTIESNDPLRNWIRSNEDIYAPDFLSSPPPLPAPDDKLKAMTFQATAESPLPGVAWSKKDIVVGSPKRDGSGQVTNAIDGTNKDAAYSSTNGLMAPHATLNYNAYDLKLKDLNKPSGTTNEVPPGDYVLKRTEIPYTENVYNWVPEHHHGGGHWELDTTKSGTKIQIVNDLVYTGPDKVERHLVQDTPSAPLKKETALLPSYPGEVTYDGNPYSYREIKDVKLPPNTQPKTTDVINIANGFSDPAMTYNFNDGKFSASSAGPLHVAGDLDIRAEGSAPVPSLAFEKPPTLIGTEPTVGNYGFLYSKKNADIKDTSDSDSKYKISVQGTVTGSGAVAASGDLTLGGSSEVSMDKNNKGLVLWSGKNITFDVVHEGKMAFKGLVYAKGDVKLSFKGLVKGGGASMLNTLDLEGALVAQSGAIQMGHAKKVRMKYNKDYLKIFTTGLPENTARFAQVSFKVF